MLNNTVTRFFQNLFNRITGSSFKVARNPFIKILQDGQCQWVTFSTFGCDPGEINYHDSLYKGKITDNVKKQICKLLRSKEKKVKVYIMSVQQQKNKTDCGM